MPSRLLFGLAFLATALALAELPLATFSGSIHGVSKKQITIETAEGNLVDFDITKKTRVTRGGKQIAAEDLQTGDSVTIEAKQEMVSYLVAVTITTMSSAKR